MKMESELLGPFCAFMSSVTWAVGSTRYSQLAQLSSPFTVNTTRALVALPLFVAFALLSGGPASFAALDASRWGWLVLSMISSYGLGDVLFLWSALRLGVPGALAIASTYPLWTALAGDHITVGQWLGLLLTVTGVVTVILSTPAGGHRAGRPDGKSGKSHARLWGVLCAFGTSFFWVLNSVSVQRAATGVHPAVVNTVRMGLALLVCGALGRVFARSKPVVLGREELIRSLPVFGFEAFGGSLFFAYGLGHSSLVVGATLSSLAPVLAVPVAWALKTEKVSILRSAGVFSVVAGLFLLVGPKA